MATYTQHIDAFVNVCRKAGRDPLKMHEFQILNYIKALYDTGHAEHGVGIRVTALRAFFGAALRLGIIQHNPCDNIHVGSWRKEDDQFHFFTQEKIQEIFDEINKDDNEELRLRNEAMFLLMANEGLRVVELTRMNDEDIDWEQGVIIIHGKGHEGKIYPSFATMKVLDEYVKSRSLSLKEGLLTPTFVSFSHRNYGTRIQRNGIRKVMDNVLTALGYKEKGVSCHVLRHSCGTNLYAATKDLRMVQETLRQRDPNVTARYAHVQERMSRRATNAISPNIEQAE